jgi:exopolyphosphatase/guanosine-5'-triphosphate,3'-diphosphate pyrophosphatase
MRVGIIDVGANTVRLLVAEQTAQGPHAIKQQKARLSLGAEVELDGFISAERIMQTAECVRSYAWQARVLGASKLDVLITSPGRQASNGRQFAEALSAATGTSAQILSSTEEGELAYLGSTSGVELDGSALVCDIGGGSTQLVVGDGPTIEWQTSLNIGSLRLARRCDLTRKASSKRIAVVRADVERMFKKVDIPAADRGLATGGTARALAYICGDELNEDTLDRAISQISLLSPAKISENYPIGRWRAKRLLAGALIIAEAQSRAGVPLEVVPGGIREGAVLAMLEQAVA